MLKKFFKFSFFIFCLMLAINCRANARDDSKIKLAKLFSTIQTLQADFTQITVNSKGKKIQNSTGKLSLERPNKFRWETVLPNRQLIIVNQNKMWIYDPDLAQVTIHRLNLNKDDTPALLLSHTDFVLDKKFIIHELPATGAWTWFELKPIQKNQLFETIKFGFSKGQLLQMQLLDHLNHKIIIHLKNVKSKVDFKSNDFIFKAPPNTDVINES